MKQYPKIKLNINYNSIHEYKSKAKMYLFEICFYMYLILQYSFQTSVFYWNKSIDLLHVNLPHQVTKTFSLHSFKIHSDENDSFKYICYTKEIDRNQNTDSYKTTYTHDIQHVLKNINTYDYIVVNHYDGIKKKELFKRVFTKEDVEDIQKNEGLIQEYEILRKNPFVYLSVNYNTKRIDFDLSNNSADSLDINETLDCYLKLKEYYVKGNRIDRDFMHLLFMNEYNVNLDEHPTYIIDVIDNEITEKRYSMNDGFLYQL
jgi:hypothetical protein